MTNILSNIALIYSNSVYHNILYSKNINILTNKIFQLIKIFKAIQIFQLIKIFPAIKKFQLIKILPLIEEFSLIQIFHFYIVLIRVEIKASYAIFFERIITGHTDNV